MSKISRASRGERPSGGPRTRVSKQSKKSAPRDQGRAAAQRPRGERPPEAESPVVDDEDGADVAATDSSAAEADAGREFHRNRSGERLQKVLARAGIASRRAAEALIVAGRVRVDGRIVTELGVRVSPRARVELDGRKIVAEHFVYILLHKPRGVVCTLKDPEGRPNVGEYLREVGARVAPVGRLDFHTSGALLCTNDGEFAAKLAHPRYHVEKDYVAKVRGVLDQASLARFSESIEIDGRKTRPADVTLLRVEGDKSWIGVKLEEGKNRQVRRLGEHAGFLVMRLVRVSQAGVSAEGLRPGEWRYLTMDELAKLQEVHGVPRRVRPPPVREEKHDASARPRKRTPQRGRAAVHGLNMRSAAGRHSSLMLDEDDMPLRTPKRGPSRFESGTRVAPSRSREGAVRAAPFPRESGSRTAPFPREGGSRSPRPPRDGGSRDSGAPRGGGSRASGPSRDGGSRGPGPSRAGGSRAAGPSRDSGSRAAGPSRDSGSRAAGPSRDGGSRSGAFSRDGGARPPANSRAGATRGPQREGTGRPGASARDTAPRGRDAGARGRVNERGGRGSGGRRGT
ncbi:MAG TPA: pseudouridine synthase [Burkholderiales bacterium]|nr:pseudouridine synthase [Burkholderiales bacterium]